MRLQLLSDLHLESEPWQPEPAPGAELLVLAGDIDARWEGLALFKDWPVPVWLVPGNHEYDGRDLDEALPALRAHCASLGIEVLERECRLWAGADGRTVRVLGTTRWCDFEVFGAAQRERAMRAGEYFARVQRSTRGGQVFDAAAVRAEAQVCRDWLERELAQPAQGRWDATLVVTHFAPSLRSADPRYGKQPGTASFCNDDEDLLQRADVWLHGHVHCRHDYTLARAGLAPVRVISQARGLGHKGEDAGFDALRLIEV